MALAIGALEATGAKRSVVLDGAIYTAAFYTVIDKDQPVTD